VDPLSTHYRRTLC